MNRAESAANLSRVFQCYSPDFGGKWVGVVKRSAVLRCIATYLDGEDRACVSSRFDAMRVRCQRYDWTLNV